MPGNVTIDAGSWIRMGEHERQIPTPMMLLTISAIAAVRPN
jgi:hypothetical protein